MGNDPTVMVKKSDGTLVKMKLSDLKSANNQVSKLVEDQVQAPAQKPVPSQNQTSRVSEQLKTAKTVPAPARPIQKVEKITIKPQEMRSLLDEKLGLTSDASLTSQKRESQVESVLKNLNFPVPPNYENRLRSVIQLRLKDLRSEEETRETVLRSMKDGGLGLSENQTEKLLRACADAIVKDAKSVEKIEPLIRKPQKIGSAQENKNYPHNEKLLPMKEPEELPAVSAPFNSFVSFVHKPGMVKENVVSKFINEEKGNEPIFKLNTQPQAVKKFMQDIESPPAEMGPIEEIKYMTLTDFRRLSDKPKEAAKRLQQKLFNLQDESFILYMDAVSAYHTSPLYLDYMQAACASLATRRTLAAVLNSDRNKIQLSEVEALIEMEKEL